MSDATTPSETPPGWYPHPSMVDTQRYWDGSNWTDAIAPATQPTPTAPQPGPGGQSNQPGPYNQPGQPNVVQVQEPRNGLAIAALCLGIVGMLFGLIPFTGFIAFGLGVVGLILGLSNRGRLKSGRSNAKKMTWAGVITSLIALALGIWGMVIVFTAVEDLDEGFDCLAKADTAEEIDAC